MLKQLSEDHLIITLIGVRNIRAVDDLLNHDIYQCLPITACQNVHS